MGKTRTLGASVTYVPQFECGVAGLTKLHFWGSLAWLLVVCTVFMSRDFLPWEPPLHTLPGNRKGTFSTHFSKVEGAIRVHMSACPHVHASSQNPCTVHTRQRAKSEPKPSGCCPTLPCYWWRPLLCSSWFSYPEHHK